MPHDADAFLTQLTSHAIELYSLPTVAMEVVRLAERPEVDVKALRMCIENDPALAAKILKTANSSLFGRGRKVGDLNQAIGVLGVKPLKLLALGFSLPKDLIEGQDNKVLSEYWRRSLLKAAAAREICRRWWSAEGDDAFVAGLLEDVGALALLKMLGSPYEEVLGEAFSTGVDPRVREREAFGFDRTAVSVRLLRTWGLPGELIDAIRDDDFERLIVRKPASDRERLKAALRLANLFVAVLRGGDKSLLARLLGEAARSGNITWSQIEDLASGLQQSTRQLADILALPKPQEVDYSLILERAHEQLAELAADAAADLARARYAPPAINDARLPASASSNTSLTAPANDNSVARLAAAVRDWPATNQPADHSAALSNAPKAISPKAIRAIDEPRRPRRTATATSEYASDPVLIDRAAVAIETCRRNRAPLSLALVAIDDFESVLLARGPKGASAVLRMVESALDAAGDESFGRLQLDERCLAVLLPDCDKSAAIGVTRQLMKGLERKTSAERDANLITLSAGLATLPAPAKGFPVPELIAAAARCLHSAQSSGGRSCKSIDIF